jgi:amidase
MNGMPDVDAVVAAAKSLGINLSAEEAVLYHERVVDQLSGLEAFVQSRLPEARPEMLFPERAPGYRPSAEEDRFNAWLWKCRIEGAPDGPLTGKTVSFKDHVAVAGHPLTFGSYVMDGFIADFDATIVTRVLAAGGTIVGKNTMNGLAGGMGSGGTVGDYGRPLNPHNPDHITGGSSSGSGAALAAGEVDISFGGDQGGSIRSPAAHCGVYGLKPTFGLVSHFGIGFGSDQSIDHTGPMAVYVEDMAAALEAVAGYDGYDPRQSRAVPERMNATAALANGVSGLKIGVLDEGFVDAEPDVRDAVMEAVDVLGKAGAEVSKVSVPEHLSAGTAFVAMGPEGTRAVFDIGFFGAFTKTYYPAALIAAIDKIQRNETDRLAPAKKLALITAQFSREHFHGAVYAKAQNVRPLITKAFDDALSEVDVLVMPTVVKTAPAYDEDDTSYLTGVKQALNRQMISNTRTYDYTGHPALSVPCGKSGGLPIGMQLVGRHFADPLLLQVAYAYQHSVNWDDMLSATARARAV